MNVLLFMLCAVSKCPDDILKYTVGAQRLYILNRNSRNYQ